MTFQVTVEPSGRQFPCDDDETVLEAALRAGIGLPYGCKNGACGSCKGKLLGGSVVHRGHQQRALSAAEEAQGLSLFCCAQPRSDITIEAREVAGATDFPVKKMPARVIALEHLAPDVIAMTLQLPANEKLAYRAGQYIEFILKDGQRRSYSLANAPHIDAPLTLHIRHLPGGLFTDQVFGTLKARDIVRIEGPQGTFFMREDSDKPMLLLASGTGFAPLKAIVEHALHGQSQRPMVLYWGGRRPPDLYMLDWCEQTARAHPQFRYVPVVSDALAEDGWSGRSGLVHRAAMSDLPDMHNYQVYACGAPPMVEAAKTEFVARCGLPADEFFADAFTSAKDLLPPA